MNPFRFTADTEHLRILFICRGGYFRSQLMKNLLWLALREQHPQLLSRITGDAAALSGTTLNYMPSKSSTQLALKYHLPWPSASRGLQLNEMRYGHPHHLIICSDANVLRGVRDYAAYYYGEQHVQEDFSHFVYSVKDWLSVDLDDIKSEDAGGEAEEVLRKAQAFIQLLLSDLKSHLV